MVRLIGNCNEAHPRAVDEENAVSIIVVLKGIELIPVLKLEPFLFAMEARSATSGIYEDMPTARQT